MRSFKAIIWFSVLIIIGEVLIFSDLNIVPLSGGRVPRVLGETTDNVLDEVVSRSYPASYYVEQELEPEPEEQADSPLEFLKEEKAEAEEVEVKTDNSRSKEQADVDVLIDLFNSSEAGRVAPRDSSGVSQSQVDDLINKNTQLLLKRSIKELEQISDDLDMSFAE